MFVFVFFCIFICLYICICIFISVCICEQQCSLLLRLSGSHKTQAAENQPRTLFPENQRQPLFRHFANYHRDSVHKLLVFLSPNRLFYGWIKKISLRQKANEARKTKEGQKTKGKRKGKFKWEEKRNELCETWEWRSRVKNLQIRSLFMFWMIPQLSSSFVLLPIFNCAFSNHQAPVEPKLVQRLMRVKPRVLQMYCLSLSNAGKSRRGKDPHSRQNRPNSLELEQPGN